MSDMSEPNGAGRAEIEQELARLRAERRTLAGDLAGEDPADPGVGDRGDQAQALEGDADLARVDGRIREIEHVLAGQDSADQDAGLADGTVVTLKFADGDQATLRVVTIPEQGGTDEVLTADSPLGRALTGHRAGDTITYSGPDGELQATLVDLRPPTS